MNKAAVFIGMGDIEVGHIRRAKEIGFRTIVMNRDPEAATLKAADVPLNISATNTRKLCEWANINREVYDIKAIYTGCDRPLEGALMAEILDIPGNPIEAAYACENKIVAKKLWRRRGVSTPPFDYAANIAEARQIARQIGFPTVIKPVDFQCSSGVAVLTDMADLNHYYDAARKGSSTGTMLLEKYIDGLYIDVNGLLHNGAFYPGPVNSKLCPADLNYIVTEVSTPSGLPEETEREALDLLRDAARAVGFGNGPVAGDLIYDKKSGRFYVLEIANRFHGPLVTDGLYPEVLGIDLMRGYLEARYYEDMTYFPYRTNSPYRCGKAMAILPEPGRVESVANFDEARSGPGMIDAWLRIKPGDEVGPYLSNYDIPGYVLVGGDSWTDVDNKLDRFRRTLKIKTAIKTAA